MLISLIIVISTSTFHDFSALAQLAEKCIFTHRNKRTLYAKFWNFFSQPHRLFFPLFYISFCLFFKALFLN